MTTIYVKEGTELPDRVPFEEYRTPQLLAQNAVRYFCEHIHRGDYPVRDILDPSAGKYGVWGLEMKKEFPDATLVGMDIQDFERPSVEYDFWLSGRDAMTTHHIAPFDLICTNPPYNILEKFIEKCWGELREDRHMLFLMRLNCLASDKRFELYKRIHLTDVITSVQRVSFYGKGTNATEYGVFVFHKSPVPNPGRITAKMHWIKWR